MAIQMSNYRLVDRPETRITATVSDNEFLMTKTANGILIMIAEKIAERYVEEHYGEIAVQLDQNAIANLAIAEAGKKIAEEIRTRPVVVREGHRRSVLEDILG